jgi:hypothetical protein
MHKSIFCLKSFLLVLVLILSINCFCMVVPIELNKTLQNAKQGDIVELEFSKLNNEDILNSYHINILWCAVNLN